MRFGMLTAIRPSGVTNHYGVVWIVKCDCGNEVKMGASELLRKPKRKTQVPKSCGCYRKRNRGPKYKGVGDLSSTKFRGIMARAKYRDQAFKITIRWAWDLFVRQEKKCALTGLPITLHPSSVEEGASTASLDRIDSSKGYIKGNVQWVHVVINFMKHSLAEEEFVRWCRLVSDHDRLKHPH